MLRISCKSEDFPTGTVANGTRSLPVTWDDILWAAITVGRPNRYYVLPHGFSSVYEALFRWSLVRMTLEQNGPRGCRLRRTSAAKTLDPTEKGAVNYFLGMTFCKLFASKLLNTPWLLHLDVFRPALNPVLTGRSRPDLVGFEHSTNCWHAFECKGRSNPPDLTTKFNAKTQAQRLISVKGMACALHIGAITYFRDDVLNFYWRDPPPEYDRGIEVPFGTDAWQYYYSPFLEAIRSAGYEALSRDTDALVTVEGSDIKIGVHPTVAKYLVDEQWERAMKTASEAAEEMVSDGYQQDGLIVRAGQSWTERFKEPNLIQG